MRTQRQQSSGPLERSNNRQPRVMALNTLPHEVLQHIIRCGGEDAAIPLYRVSKTWHQIASSSVLWQELVERKWGAIPHTTLLEAACEDYYAYYVRCMRCCVDFVSWERRCTIATEPYQTLAVSLDRMILQTSVGFEVWDTTSLTRTAHVNVAHDNDPIRLVIADNVHLFYSLDGVVESDLASQFVVTASRRNAVSQRILKKWGIESGECVATFRVRSGVSALSYLGEQRLFLCYHSGGSEVIHLETGTRTTRNSFPLYPTFCPWTAETLLLTGVSNTPSSVVEFNTYSGRSLPIFTPKHPYGPTVYQVVKLDNEYYATVEDEAVTIRRTSDRSYWSLNTRGHPTSVHVVNRYSGLLLTSLGSGTIHIWKWKTGRLLKTFDLPISDCSCIIPYRDEIIAMAGARVEIWRPACVSGLDTNRIPDKATLFGSYLESHWEEFPSL